MGPVARPGRQRRSSNHKIQERPRFPPRQIENPKSGARFHARNWFHQSGDDWTQQESPCRRSARFQSTGRPKNGIYDRAAGASLSQEAPPEVFAGFAWRHGIFARWLFRQRGRARILYSIEEQAIDDRDRASVPASCEHARRFSACAPLEQRRRPMRLTRRTWLQTAVALTVLLGGGAHEAQAEDTIKIGILHSLSGTMAISETILKDQMLMQVAELNAHGGLLGKTGRGGRRRPGLELAALCREGARTSVQGQGRGRVRLLDLGVAQIGVAGVRGAQRPVVLPARI